MKEVGCFLALCFIFANVNNSHQQAVAIVAGLQNLTVPVGQNIVFQTSLNRDNVTNGVWRRGNTVIQNNGKTRISVFGSLQQLFIANVQPSDAGTYFYSVNGQTTSGSLNVVQGLVLIIGLANQTVFVSGTAQFTAVLSESGVLSGTWSKNGVTVVNNSKTQITTDGLSQRLTIYNAQGSDIGAYTYSVNTLASTAYLNVLGAVVNGNWGAWTTWTDPSCGITCGSTNQVFRTRFRLCNNPAPSNGGSPCPGSPNESQQKSCVFATCAVVVNGNWGAWTTWTDPSCGITCGSRIPVVRRRSRLCNNPAPSNGGSSCPGLADQAEAKSCIFASCPVLVNGNWGAWTTWNDPSCGITCGSTNQVFRTRIRFCNNPAPSNGGSSCPGSANESQQKSCVFASCPVLVNGNWGAWTTWNDPSCGITCGSTNQVFRTRIRFCNNPAPSNGGSSCPGSANESQQKSCVFASCPVAGICSSAKLVDGVGYRYHNADCNKYIQCYYNPNGKVIAAERLCPFGFFWNQVTIQCDQSWKVSCPLDKCTDDCTPNFAMSDSCRSYWECDRNLVSIPQCCSIGFSYVDGQGCQPNFFCRDLCPSACADRDVCAKVPIWSSSSAYNESMGNLGWGSTSCVANTVFDVTDCSCSAVNSTCQASYDLSFANGASVATPQAWANLTNVGVIGNRGTFGASTLLSANVSFPTAARGCPLIVRFRYREAVSATGKRVLISTSDCRKGNSLVVSVDDANLMFDLTSWYGWTVKLPVTTADFPRTSWKTVTLLYSGYDMTVAVESDGLKYTARVAATQSTIMNCGLMFGSDGLNSTMNFLGDLEKLTLFKCNPGGFY